MTWQMSEQETELRSLVQGLGPDAEVQYDILLIGSLREGGSRGEGTRDP